MTTRRGLSLELKLPLLITALLVLVIGSFIFAAYREVRRSTLAVAADRLAQAATQLQGLLSTGSPRRFVEAQTVAAHPAVTAYLRNPRPPILAAALEALQQPLLQDSVNAAVELWTPTGKRLLTVGRPLPALDTTAARTMRRLVASLPAAIGPLRAIGDSLLFSVIARVGDSTARLGFVVNWRRAVSSPGSARQVAALIGSDAGFLVGNVRGDVWTDLTRPRAGPPVELLDRRTVIEYARPGEDRFIALLTPIPGTPWLLLVEFPRDRTFGPVRSFVRRIAVIGLLLIVAGAAGAWAVSHRIAPPLKRLTLEVERLGRESGLEDASAGPERDGDEIRRLAGAFDAMALALEQRRISLARAEQRYRLLVEASPSGKIMVDRHGKIALVNREAERLFGYPRDEIVGQPVERLLPKRFRGEHAGFREAFFLHPHARAMGAGRDLFGLRRDGKEIPVEIGLNPIETDEGTFVLAAVVDISARKQAEEELRRSNEELERFAYVASHDLQEPLRTVASYVQLLARRYRDRLDQEATEFIDFAVDGAKRMERLIEDLLAFSRVGTRGAAPVATSAEAALTSALGGLRAAIEEAGATVTYDPLPDVLADPGQLEQVFANLVGNALKFRGATPPHVHASATSNGPQCTFRVRDNGIGIDPQYFERIFVIFQRLHVREAYPGTGIGLAICKKIVARHGGRIWVESVPGAGSAFYFTLPMTGDGAA